MFIWVPGNEISTDDAVEFTFSRATHVGDIGIVVSVFDQKLSPETDYYPSGIHFTFQDLCILIIIAIACNIACSNMQLHREFHHQTSWCLN